MKTLTALPQIETPQLMLREIEPSDATAFSRFMLQESYQAYIAMRFSDEAEIKAFVTRQIARQGAQRRNAFHLAAEEKSSGETVGDGFLIMQRPGTIEIGWGVHPAMWEMGLGSEIGRALVAIAIERLEGEKVWAKVMSANAASARLAKRIGMRVVQSHGDYPVGGGRFEAVDIYAIRASDYFDLAY